MPLSFSSNKTVTARNVYCNKIELSLLVVAPTPEPVKQKTKRRRKNDSTNESKIKDTVDKIEKEDTQTGTRVKTYIIFCYGMMVMGEMLYFHQLNYHSAFIGFRLWFLLVLCDK